MTREVIDVHAAGGLLRRESPSGPEFALVHRARYDDWSIPKGKLDPGEQHRQAAIREVIEETGFRPRVGAELPSTRYVDKEGRRKLVRYWLMTPISGEFVPGDEVGEMRWLRAADAVALLSYEHDREVVRAAVGLDAPVFLIRHGKAGSRSKWAEDDMLRPLSKAGRGQAEAITELLASEGISRVISSPYVRCVQTVRPLALTLGIPVEERREFSEGAPLLPAKSMIATLGEPTAVCSHGDVIPAIIEHTARTGAQVQVPRDYRKGSTWRLERAGGRIVRATCLGTP